MNTASKTIFGIIGTRSRTIAAHIPRHLVDFDTLPLTYSNVNDYFNNLIGASRSVPLEEALEPRFAIRDTGSHVELCVAEDTRLGNPKRIFGPDTEIFKTTGDQLIVMMIVQMAIDDPDVYERNRK